ncbi:MAG: hypothetical protein HYV77_03060 [Candidatus Wildermuthbacteria bacterium]|nr:hypothetical protein [Candidatus Wildermuthbacteria bacterium]
MNNQSRTAIPTAATSLIENYKHLKVKGQQTVRCPYYRNPRSGRERWGLNAFSGKGSPQEIEQEIGIIEKLENKNFAELSEEDIRDILRKRKLGVECSGFISHVLDAWLLAEKKKKIYQVLKFKKRGILGTIASKLRPFTHIDVETLTDPQNADEFADINHLQAGDLLRFFSEIDPAVVVTEGAVDHAVLATKIERDAEGKVKRIHYAQSVREKIGEGIKEGIITIINPGTPLEKQQWEELPNTGTTINLRSTPPKFYHLKFL